MDFMNLESSLEQAEQEVDVLLEQRQEAEAGEERLRDAIAALKEDLETSEILQGSLAERQEERKRVQSSLEIYKNQAELLEQELEERIEETEHSRSVLEELDRMGEDVQSGLRLLEERQLLIDQCREQLQILLDKLGIAGGIMDGLRGESGAESSSAVEKEKDRENHPETYDSLAQYMSDHNYSRQDYPVYSQDADWRMLALKENPELVLPPMTQEEAQKQVWDFISSHNYGRQDSPIYSQDPKYRYLMQYAYPDFKLPPRSAPDNLGGWADRPCDETVTEAVRRMNPHHGEGAKWQTNCQRCVPAFEMRMRGYNVEAQACPNFHSDWLAGHWSDVWENPQIEYCQGDGLDEISRAMKAWGNGARAQITIDFRGIGYGHTFVAARWNNQTYFIDPQTGNMHSESLFSRAVPGRTTFCRIDTLNPAGFIKDCCKECS